MKRNPIHGVRQDFQYGHASAEIVGYAGTDLEALRDEVSVIAFEALVKRCVETLGLHEPSDVYIAATAKLAHGFASAFMEERNRIYEQASVKATGIDLNNVGKDAK